MESTSFEVNGTVEQKTFQERLSDMPAYTMTLSQLQSLYSTLKERNELLSNAFSVGEQYFERLTTAAKPVVIAATTSALKVAKPVVGEVEDPVSAIDTCASEALAKVQEKLPFVKQTPGQIAESAKTSAFETASYYYEKVHNSTVGQQTVKQVDNAVSFSELMVEICFPTDGGNPEDLKELEKAEEDADKSILIRATNLKDRAYRRGTKTMMTYEPVKKTVDMVVYAQQHISDITEKLRQGTNYVTVKTQEAKTTALNKYPELKDTVQNKVLEGRKLLSENWEHVYNTTMYIPQKTLQVTGEVYISSKEIIFAYTKAHSITEMPHAIAEMAENYYNNMKADISLTGVKGKAFAFVYVPAQVVTKYLQSSRVVQWIVPKAIESNSLKVLESEVESEDRPSRTEEVLPSSE